jgi:hypothetical protein
LVHFLENFALVDGGAILGLVVVREMGSEAGCESTVKPINRRLTYADRKGLLVHEQAGGSRDLGVIVVQRRKDGVALYVLALLLDVAKGGMRIL